MKKLFLSHVLTVLATIFLVLFVQSCMKTDEDLGLSDRALYLGTPPIQRSFPDTTDLVEVAYGSEISVIPSSISSGEINGIKWWQAKLDAKGVILPTNYQRGVPPNYERVTIGDTSPITANKKYFISYKIKI